MRILMVSKACIVGIYQRKLELIAQYPDIELRVLVPSSWQDERGITYLERVYTDGYELIETPLRFNGNFHLHYYPEFAHHLKAWQPDIVHLDEEPYNLATWLMLRATRQTSAKALFFSWQNIERQYPPPFRWLENYVLKHSDFALMGTASAADIWRAKGYRGDLAVIPQFGVDANLFVAADKPKTADEPVQIGYAGRLVPEKGIDLILQALAKLKHLNWQLRIIGGGPAQTALQQQTQQLGIADKVTFLGLVPSIEMPTHFQNLDILVIPSRTQSNWKEQYGRVIIEAMASGTVVIGSDSGAIPDVIGEAGLIFPEDDEQALGQALQKLISDADCRAELIRLGQQRVRDNFTQEHIAEQTVEVYRRLFEQR